MGSALSANPAVHAIGIALIWFVVQGAIVAGIVAALLAVWRRAPAHVRYVVACAGLGAMAVIPIVTAAHQWTPALAIAADPPGVTRGGPSPVSQSDISAAPEVGWRARLAADRVAPIVVLGWIAGVLVLTARLFGGWLQVIRVRRHARRTPLLERSETLTRLGAQLKIRRAVPILESALVGLPVVIGWMKPVILVPAGVFAGLTPGQVDAILAHELAHIRRGDYVVNAVQRVVEIVLFYHPAVWWVSACIRREREHCCDDLAAPLSSSPLAYAHALVALEERRGRAPALAMAATGGGLFARVRRIVDPSWSVESAFPKGAVMTLVSSVLALVLTGAVSVGQAASTPSPDRPPAAAPAVPVEAPGALGEIGAARPDASPGLVPRMAAAAQASGEILGVVADPQNGVVPGATITVDPIGRAGASRTAVTDASGKFALTDVPDGAYLFTVSIPGFKRDERRVDVASGAVLNENIQLTLGSLRESMTVVSGGPAQQTPTSAESVAGLLDAARKATDAGRLADAEASLRAALAVLHAAQPQPPPPVAGAVRVGGDIKEPRKIRNVDPVYPQAARAAGIQGVVVLEATLDRDGSVADAVVVRGVPELNDAALDAVRQWVFTPTLLNGVPVSVLMTVTVSFAAR